MVNKKKQIIIILFFIFGGLSCTENRIPNGNYFQKIDDKHQLKMLLPNNAIIDTGNTMVNTIILPNVLDSPYIQFYFKKVINHKKESEIYSLLDTEISNSNAHMIKSYSEQKGRINNNYFTLKYFHTKTNGDFYSCDVHFYNGTIAIFYFHNFKSEFEVKNICDRIYIEKLDNDSM